MSETKYDQYSTPCLLVGPNATPNPVKDASSAVFAGAAMKREPGIGSDVATEHPGHVACFVVFAEAAVGSRAHVCTWPLPPVLLKEVQWPGANMCPTPNCSFSKNRKACNMAGMFSG